MASMNLSATFKEALSEFKAEAKLSKEEENDFEMTSLDDLRQLIARLQKGQEDKRSMKFMKRLKPFLESMQHYGRVVEVFLNTSNVIAFVWGPMKFILLEASTHVEALNAILDAYQNIGEQIPLLADFELLASNDHMKEVLGMIYADILRFHRQVLKHFRKPFWKKVFSATWRGSISQINHIVDNMRRHQQLIDSRVTVMEFQEICAVRKKAADNFAFAVKAEDDRRRDVVKAWLSGFSNSSEQDRNRDVRRVAPESGQWLLQDSRFRDWLDLDYCSTPLLWLTGIPGAGKTILASVVIDKIVQLSQTSSITLAYFYCKYGDAKRNSFLSVARSLVAQLFNASPDSLAYIYETASMCSDVHLTSQGMAKELLDIVISACRKTSTIYLVIDGIDECGRDERKDIATYFQAVSDALPVDEKGRFRCLFVSQDDGVARKDFGQMSMIKIKPSDTRNDIESFSKVWHGRMERKFGELRSPNENIANIVAARAQGVFLFAKLMVLHLEDQPTRQQLCEELDPSKFPVNLDEMYERIMQRMMDSRTDKSKEELRKVLGWIVCAPRPLRWREVQAAVSIDLDEERMNMNRKLLESPKGLLAAFIEVNSNGMVELVHGTARDYLTRHKHVEPSASHASVALLSMAYLGLPQMDKDRSHEEIKTDLLGGVYAFLDYASACWAVHLQFGIAKPDNDEANEQLEEIQETLDAFIETHWSTSSKQLPVPKTVKETLSRLSTSGSFNKITQAVAWARKQLGVHGQAPSEDEALSLWQVVKSVRSVLETMQSSSLSQDESRLLHDFHGENRFKCPRISCFYYHEGFPTGQQREHHILKHERPFLCVVKDCHFTKFGFAAEADLKRHFFENHGIDMLDDSDFPALTHKAQSPAIKSVATSKHTCPVCSKVFTRGHNLKSHMRSHKGEKPFDCRECGMMFSRSSDRNRHERQHDGTKLVCFGTLDDGTEWGCRAEFSRQDKREGHFRTATGRKCIMPLVKERLRKQEAVESDALVSGGEVMLPSFPEFLAICGVDLGTFTVSRGEDFRTGKIESPGDMGRLVRG